MTSQPLTDAELDRLDAILVDLGEDTMTLEELDGFLAALGSAVRSLFR